MLENKPDAQEANALSPIHPEDSIRSTSASPQELSLPTSSPVPRPESVLTQIKIHTNKKPKIDFSSLIPKGQANSPSRAPKQTLETFRKSIENEKENNYLSIDVESLTPKQQFSSWGISLVVHSTIVLILAFLFFPLKNNENVLDAVFSTNIGDQLDFLTEDEGNLNPNQAENYKLDVPQELKVEDVLIFEKQELPFENDVAAPLFDQSRIDATELLSGRTDPGLKNDLLSKYGGDKLTEEAVALGLEWLRKQQNKDGSWSLQGPYANGINAIDNRPAATALSLLAFQGAGNTRSKGEHSALVKRGWTWLLKQQNADGSFIPEEHSSEALFYTQAVCTIALCELITMEKNVTPNIRKQATSAVNFIIENQHRKFGGWKYVPQESSDLSVTGWCLAALKTAEMANISIPNSTYQHISSFLDAVAYNDDSEYAYQRDNGKLTDQVKRPSMTATGLMCREYLGWGPDNLAIQKGAALLADDENLIRFPKTEEEKEDFFHNVYGWYSTSMALKSLGPYNKHWSRWNTALSKELPQSQVSKGAQEAGSWDPQNDEYSFGGGRLYVTCLSILCLEVYYRHLPMFKQYTY